MHTFFFLYVSRGYIIIIIICTFVSSFNCSSTLEDGTRVNTLVVFYALKNCFFFQYEKWFDFWPNMSKIWKKT